VARSLSLQRRITFTTFVSIHIHIRARCACCLSMPASGRLMMAKSAQTDYYSESVTSMSDNHLHAAEEVPNNKSRHRMSGDNINLKFGHRSTPLLGALCR
jgi:hypothetical protein